MKYRELIKRVQHLSGFSDSESKDALQLMVEAISIRLNEGERKDFASQLPQELQDIALSVYPTEGNIRKDLLQQFMEIQQISADRAKKQIKTTWQAIKEAITRGEIDDIKSQLTKKTVATLQ
jgi:uncharacterized protein (DUF2267 family)